MARRDRRRKEAGAFAVSVLVHLALLAVLARVAVPAMYQPPTSPAPDVQLQLVPETPAPSTPPAPRAIHRAVARPPPAPAAARRPAPERAPAPAARAIQAVPRPVPPKAPEAPPAPPSHATASIPTPGVATGAPTVPGAAGGANRWRVTGGDEGEDGVRKFLRATVGCSHEDYVRLSPAERATCDRRMGEEARSIGIAPDKLAGFIVAAEAQERARAARTGPLAQPLAPCQGASNFNVSCIPPKPRE